MYTQALSPCTHRLKVHDPVELVGLVARLPEELHWVGEVVLHAPLLDALLGPEPVVQLGARVGVALRDIKALERLEGLAGGQVHEAPRAAHRLEQAHQLVLGLELDLWMVQLMGRDNEARRV
jgi:hypothetical protein